MLKQLIYNASQKMNNDKLGMETKMANFTIQGFSNPIMPLIAVLGIIAVATILLQFTSPWIIWFFVSISAIVIIVIIVALIKKSDLLRDSKYIIAMKRLELTYGDRASGILKEMPPEQFQPSLSPSKPIEKKGSKR